MNSSLEFLPDGDFGRDSRRAAPDGGPDPVSTVSSKNQDGSGVAGVPAGPSLRGNG
jgi:hypothetical protein